MPKTYTNPEYEYKRSPDQSAGQRTHHPVIIVGAGPAGLSAAIDLAMHGIQCVVIDDNNTVSVGSRAICFAKRTLEICDRYQTGERMVDKGVTWNLGKVYWKDNLVYEFNLLPEEDHKMPAFINLQQYYFEEYMIERCDQLDEIDLRWLSKVSNIQTENDKTLLDVTTQDGTYQLSCDYMIVADGASSGIRTQLGLPFNGQVFNDRFLIADIVMKADFPTERRFWFDAPFHPNQSTLLHKQPDNVWRIDFQLGWDADPEEERKEENIIPRVKRMLQHESMLQENGGKEIEFELDWASVYTFRCRKMDSFIHKRIIFTGDAAHQVSPFGARGGNGAVQSVDNVGWKLAHILSGTAPTELLSTYDNERQHGANENIMNSSRSTDFMTPKNKTSETFQHAVLELANQYPFARNLVNSGRLSLPCVYENSPLNTIDSDDFADYMRPGSACTDAPISIDKQPAWLLNQLGNQFVCMIYGEVSQQQINTLKEQQPSIRLLLINTATDTLGLNDGDVIAYDEKQLVQQRYNLQNGSVYLIRPDQHVCARWRTVDAKQIIKAYNKALGFEINSNLNEVEKAS